MGVLMREFCVVEACSIHDAHNAFKWSLRTEFENKDLLRDIFVASASVRNSFDVVHRCSGAWIAEVLHPVDPLAPACAGTWSMMWKVLGIQKRSAALLEHWQLRWDDGRLLVRRGAGDAVTLIGDHSGQ